MEQPQTTLRLDFETSNQETTMIRHSRNASPTRPRHRTRPTLERLEERQLLTAGTLDTTFNPPNGYVLTGPTKGDKSQWVNDAVQIQSDGKILTAGRGANNFVLARYTAGGSLDSTFGSGGEVQTSFGALGAVARDIAIQPGDGKIIVVGDYGTDMAIARYNPNGSLDTTFGPGKKPNGKVVIDLCADDSATSVILQPDGKILVGGWTMNDANPFVTANFAIVRLNPNGTLDSGFGTAMSGIVTTDLTGNQDILDDLGLETVNGVTEIVAGGTAWVGGRSQCAIVRYHLLDGSLDTSFGNGGFVSPTESQHFEMEGASPGGIAIQADEKIVAGGFDFPNLPNSPSTTCLAVARFNIDGLLDTTFNSSGPVPGIATVNASAGANVQGDDVAIQPDGKIIVAGVSVDRHFALARLNADGSMDSTFGTTGNGYVDQSLNGNGGWAAAVTIQPSDGKIVAAGPCGVNNNDVFAVARFLNDTMPPATPLATSGGTTVTGGSGSLSSSLSFWRAEASDSVVLARTLEAMTPDRISQSTAPSSPLGDSGLLPAWRRFRWSPQTRRFAQS